MEAKSVSERNGKVLALSGNRYELAIDPGPAPEPGTPIFDAQGRVFGIEASADPLYPTSVFAIPIRYGIDLLSASRN
jgi:hypothetical protein